MMIQPYLRLEFHTGMGEVFTQSISLPHNVASYGMVPAPTKIPTVGFMASATDVIELIKKREFRKKSFIFQATNLGAMLAERMEDAEGWHDTSRVEPAKQDLRGENEKF